MTKTFPLGSTAMLEGWSNCPSPLPPVPHFAGKGHARLVGGHMQSQLSPTEASPQAWPAGQQASCGHVPPHAGASEMTHVLSGATHMQLSDPDACPQISPLTHVPPHVGASEVEHVPTHPHSPNDTAIHAVPGSHAPPHVGQGSEPHGGAAGAQPHCKGDVETAVHTQPASHAPPHVRLSFSPHPGFSCVTHVSTRVLRADAASLHVPRSSAFAIAVVNRSSALPRHSSSTAVLRRSAFARQFISSYALLPTAFVFAAAHFASPMIAAAKLARQSSTTASTPVALFWVSQPPLACARANAATNFCSTFPRQSSVAKDGSSSAFWLHLAFPYSSRPAALYFVAAQVVAGDAARLGPMSRGSIATATNSRHTSKRMDPVSVFI